MKINLKEHVINGVLNTLFSKCSCHLPKFILLIIPMALLGSSCGTAVNYSFTGTSTTAKTISIAEFYNNTDLGPANMSQVFTNQLKNYFIQNSNISVINNGEGELQMEGEISDFRLTPVAPVSTGNENDFTSASLTRLTITVKVTYINTLDETMSFKDKTFSFYRDLPNDQDVTNIEDGILRTIFERIINDIFNASVANW